MSKITKNDLVAIYKLEFYKRKKNWNYSPKSHKKGKKDSSKKIQDPISCGDQVFNQPDHELRDFNRTYSIDTGSNKSALNEAFIDSGPDIVPDDDVDGNLDTKNEADIEKLPKILIQKRDPLFNYKHFWPQLKIDQYATYWTENCETNHLNDCFNPYDSVDSELEEKIQKNETNDDIEIVKNNDKVDENDDNAYTDSTKPSENVGNLFANDNLKPSEKIDSLFAKDNLKSCEKIDSLFASDNLVFTENIDSLFAKKNVKISDENNNSFVNNYFEHIYQLDGQGYGMWAGNTDGVLHYENGFTNEGLYFDVNQGFGDQVNDCHMTNGAEVLTDENYLKHVLMQMNNDAGVTENQVLENFGSNSSLNTVLFMEGARKAPHSSEIDLLQAEANEQTNNQLAQAYSRPTRQEKANPPRKRGTGRRRNQNTSLFLWDNINNANTSVNGKTKPVPTVKTLEDNASDQLPPNIRCVDDDSDVIEDANRLSNLLLGAKNKKHGCGKENEGLMKDCRKNYRINENCLQMTQQQTLQHLKQIQNSYSDHVLFEKMDKNNILAYEKSVVPISNYAGRNRLWESMEHPLPFDVNFEHFKTTDVIETPFQVTAADGVGYFEDYPVQFDFEAQRMYFAPPNLDVASSSNMPPSNYNYTPHNTNMPLPNLNTPSHNAKMQSQNTNMQSLYTNMPPQNINMESQNTNMQSLYTNMPPQNIYMQSLNTNMPPRNKNMQQHNRNIPSQNTNMRTNNLNMSLQNINAPLQNPNMSQNLNMPSPNINIPSKNRNIPSPPVNICLPNFNVPPPSLDILAPNFSFFHFNNEPSAFDPVKKKSLRNVDMQSSNIRWGLHSAPPAAASSGNSPRDAENPSLWRNPQEPAPFFFNMVRRGKGRGRLTS